MERGIPPPPPRPFMVAFRELPHQWRYPFARERVQALCQVSCRVRQTPSKLRPTTPTPIPTKSVGYGHQRIGGSISPLSLSLSLSFSLSLYIHTHTHNIYIYITYMYIYIRPEVSAGAAISAAAAAASIIPPLGSEIRISVNRDITQVKETQCRGVQKNVEVRDPE